MGQSAVTRTGKSPKDSVELTINGFVYTIRTVMTSIRPETSLNTFIRENALLPGTKVMCHEGSCGACIVVAEIRGETLAVNSCLLPVLICNGWKIKTIESIGNKRMNYHKIQTALAEMSGSQCGYCSTGMVMNMYSLLQSEMITMKEIENSFGGNICRCTGYRSILDAFKGLASDAITSPPTLLHKSQDIEELYKLKACPKSSEPSRPDFSKSQESTVEAEVHMEFGDAKFYKVLNIESLFEVFKNNPDATYVLNGANTARGVYRLERPPVQIYVDVNDIGDLHRIEKDDATGLILGGNVTLAVAKNTFMKFSEDLVFQHLRHMANHVDLIASVPVRNIGTLAGNLMIKHKHREFPSDLFLILETAGAQLHILGSPSRKTIVNFMDFLDMDMRHKIIYSIIIPSLTPEHVYRSYKVMKRAQNSETYINAGFLMRMDGSSKILDKPNIIFGGIGPHFLHAGATEDYVNGKSLLDTSVFEEAMNMLDSELEPNHLLFDYSPEFKKTLALSLFYKFILSLRPENLDERLRSGGKMLERNISSGKVNYQSEKRLWPYNKPIPMRESIYQISGEARYVSDMPPQPHQVFCAFVHSTSANGKIHQIEATEALEMKGVIAFLRAQDVPGKNIFIDHSITDSFYPYDEKIFAESIIEYAGQPIGMICAETQCLANEAAKKVKVIYTDDGKKPIITIQDAIDLGDKNRIVESANIPARKRGGDPVHQIIKGSFECGSQYHYTIEPQCCICIPTEDGMDVYPTSSYIDLTQVAIASCLGIPNNRINISVRRLGGSYGAKLSRNNLVSCACAVAAYVLNCPARFVMTIESMMLTMGKRSAAKHEYEIGVDANGIIQYLEQKLWHNAGATLNESIGCQCLNQTFSCYNNSTWSSVTYDVITDIPSNTFMQGSGSVEATAMVENMMEQIALRLGKDSTEVRLNNMKAKDKEQLKKLIAHIKETSDYSTRAAAIRIFNEENRWMKKGINLIPMTYSVHSSGEWNVFISIAAVDGTVSVIHGNIESGQGINTKVAQVTAHILKIDIDLINVKATNNSITPNNYRTGESTATDCVLNATTQACKKIVKRLKPIKTKLSKKATWQEIIQAANKENINLCVHSMISASNITNIDPIYGVTVAEVEIDMLTGQHLIQRVDVLVDAGLSVNPEIDRGQVEGAFVMGIGYWTSEKLVYDSKTGLLINNHSWNYAVPGAIDIPVDFRIELRNKTHNSRSSSMSKAISEPPMCMSYSVLLAIRNALNSARKDAGNTDPWYQLDGPVTTETILMTSLTDKNQMTLRL